MLESTQRSVDRAVQLIGASLAGAKEARSVSTRAFPLSWILARVRDLLDPQLRACEGRSSSFEDGRGIPGELWSTVSSAPSRSSRVIKEWDSALPVADRRSSLSEGAC